MIRVVGVREVDDVRIAAAVRDLRTHRRRGRSEIAGIRNGDVAADRLVGVNVAHAGRVAQAVASPGGITPQLGVEAGRLFLDEAAVRTGVG